MRVVSWHPVLTDHMSYTLEALQNVGGIDLSINVTTEEHIDRQAQGWVKHHKIAAPIHKISSRGWFQQVLKQLWRNKNAVHLFGSPFEQPRLICALILAIVMGIKVYLISEPYSPVAFGYQNDRRRIVARIKAALRPVIYRMYGAILRQRLAGVFAISPLAVSQYQRIGISKDRIFPFGYFVPKTGATSANSAGHGTREVSGLRLIFIGTLIGRKGLDILIDAVRSLRLDGDDISLDVYGPGDHQHFNFDESTVRYCGKLPFGTVQEIMVSYDLLVLPSRYDGWGVVVNEALLAGVPVICSDKVGAAAIIEKWRCGAVFESENVVDLCRRLKQCMVGEAMLAMHQAANEVGTVLAPEVAGKYMYEVINSVTFNEKPARPVCPWYEI